MWIGWANLCCINLLKSNSTTLHFNGLFLVFNPGPWLSINKCRLVKYKYSLDLNRKALIISLFAIQSPSIDNWYADSWIHFECELDLQQQLYMIWFWYFIQIIWWKNQTSWTEFKSDIIHGRKISITLQYLVYSTTVHDNVSVHDRDRWGGHYIGRECNYVLVKPW